MSGHKARLSVPQRTLAVPTTAPTVTLVAPPPLSGIPNWHIGICYTYYDEHGETGPSPITYGPFHGLPRNGWAYAATAPSLPPGALGTKWYELTHHITGYAFFTEHYFMYFYTPGGAIVYNFEGPVDEVTALIDWVDTFSGDAGYIPFTYGMYFEGHPTTTWAAFADGSRLDMAFVIPPFMANDWDILLSGLVTLAAGNEIDVSVLLDGNPIAGVAGTQPPFAFGIIDGVIGATAHLAAGGHTLSVLVTTNQRDGDVPGFPGDYVDRYAYWLINVRFQTSIQREGHVVTTEGTTALIADLGDGTFPPPDGTAIERRAETLRVSVPPGQKWRMTVPE